MNYIYQHKSWPNLRWDSSSLLPLLSEARREQGKLLAQVSHLGLKLGSEAHAEILIEETIKTAAIEGEHLNKESVSDLSPILWTQS